LSGDKTISYTIGNGCRDTYLDVTIVMDMAVQSCEVHLTEKNINWYCRMYTT
jgi:hypothetical protein